jgi:hypothetical protein
MLYLRHLQILLKISCNCSTSSSNCKDVKKLFGNSSFERVVKLRREIDTFMSDADRFDDIDKFDDINKFDDIDRF